MARFVGYLGLGTTVAVGAAVVAARHVGPAASSPLEPGGPWRGVLVVSIVAAFALYASAAIALLRRDVPLGRLAAIGCVIQLLPLAAPLLLSTDVYTYWDYGRIGAAHGANPYAAPPSAFPHDAAYGLMGASWHHSTTIYGPLFTGISSLIAHVAPTAHDAELVFRAVAALSMVGIVLVLWRIRAAPVAVVLAGWSPLFALHFAGGGHNDALMMLLAVGGAAALRRRPWLGAALWVAAVAVKWIAIVPLVLELLLLRGRERRSALVRVGAAAVVGAALATAGYGPHWATAVRQLSEQSRRTGSLGAARWLGDVGLHHRPTVAALGLATIAFLGALAYAAARLRRRHLGIAGSGLALLQGWLNPWYTVWGATLVQFEDARVVATLLSLGLSAIVLRDALPL